jgi:hypothetical protein
MMGAYAISKVSDIGHNLLFASGPSCLEGGERGFHFEKRDGY